MKRILCSLLVATLPNVPSKSIKGVLVEYGPVVADRSPKCVRALRGFLPLAVT